MSNRCLNKDPLLNKTFSGLFFAANLEISAEWDAEGKHEERRGETSTLIVWRQKWPSSCLNFYPLIDWNEIMTAFPVAELPQHPPGNTNTLWAPAGYNERGGDSGRDTNRGGKKQQRGETDKWEIMKLKSEKMRHMETCGTTHSWQSNMDERNFS